MVVLRARLNRMWTEAMIWVNWELTRRRTGAASLPTRLRGESLDGSEPRLPILQSHAQRPRRICRAQRAMDTATECRLGCIPVATSGECVLAPARFVGR